jgi:glutamate synthase domain-containing protein 3
MAAAGIRRLQDAIGRRDLLERRSDLVGKAALVDLSAVLSARHGRHPKPDYALQTKTHMPPRREEEIRAVRAALAGDAVERIEPVFNRDRCIGVAAAGEIARRFGDAGLPKGSLTYHHQGAAGHYYAAYAVDGLEFRLVGVVADSCFTAAYGGLLSISAARDPKTSIVGNTFAYGARGGRAYIAGRAGNRFGICLRRGHDGSGARIVVEGVGANAFQYMTGGVALVLGEVGGNLGAGMTGGRVYLLDADETKLNRSYVGAFALDEMDIELVRALLEEHAAETASVQAEALLADFDPGRFRRVNTVLQPAALEVALAGA